MFIQFGSNTGVPAMSFNLTAHTKTGKKIELEQLNTEDTFYCLGYKWNGSAYEKVENLTWRQIRDRYIKKMRERFKDNLTSKEAYHLGYLLCQPYLDFSYE
jgi:hypothetical protein